MEGSLVETLHLPLERADLDCYRPLAARAWGALAPARVLDSLYGHDMLSAAISQWQEFVHSQILVARRVDEGLLALRKVQ